MKWFEAWVGPPMAAPETARLRRMRLEAMWLLATVAFTIPAIPLLKHILTGPQVGLLAALLLVLTAVHTLRYVFAKRCADDAHLDQLIARNRAEEEAA